MKPYIIDPFKNGKYILPYQIEGVERQKFISLIKSESIIGYAVPSEQSLHCSWLLRIYFFGGSALEFSASCTNVGGWQEQGSLNINFIQVVNESSNKLFNCIRIDDFKIEKVSSLVYETENIFSESGIFFEDEVGRSIVVVCGASPGAVFMKAPSDSLDEIESELDYKDYNLEIFES